MFFNYYSEKKIINCYNEIGKKLKKYFLYVTVIRNYFIHNDNGFKLLTYSISKIDVSL